MLSAVVREDACIGCGICLDACPFDAIIGAKGYLHTVLSQECIGCKLCIDPCPVDCIDLVKLTENFNKKQMVQTSRRRKQAKLERQSLAKINLLSATDIDNNLAAILNNSKI
jgi:electron transport complex protein RnfB